MSYPTPMVPIPQQQKKTNPWMVCGIAGIGCSFFAIVILAAILFPVYAKSRENGRMTICATNEKWLGLAIAQYAQDNDQRLPPTSSWTMAISKYAPTNMAGGKGSFLHCPDASGTNFGYAINQSTSLYHIADIVSVAQGILFYESDSQNINASGGLSDADLTRHKSGSYLCFIDSHVKWYSADDAKGGDSTLIWNLQANSK